MRYQQIAASGSYPYPNADIDPAKKGLEYCVGYAKAAFYDFSYTYPKGCLYNNNGDYEKFRMYALGKQSISQYKKFLGIDEVTNDTWMSVDWSVRPIVSRFRDRALSRLLKQVTEVVATPVDMLAKDELDQYYASMKAKLAVRQLMQQQNPELANHPLISLQSGEPLDIEELEMRIAMGEQFMRSEDAEKAISLGFYENDYTTFISEIYEDEFDYGITGYKEWLGDDNKAKFRRANVEAVITNLCRKKNFSDLIHAGELIDVSLNDLALVKDENGNAMFTEDQLTMFAGSLAGKYGNPLAFGHMVGWFKPYDKFKCKVLDLEFESYDVINYKMSVDESGNLNYRRAEYGRGKVAKGKYDPKRVKSIYKVKWIVGTDLAYDFGLAYDQKRSPNPKKRAQTSLSYKFYAYNFYEMRAQGVMERLIPYLDDYQLTIYKIQNWKNRCVPSGWWIDLDALENIALNKGGKNMQPKEVLDMFFSTGVLLGRSKDEAGNPMGPNWKPVIPIENSAISELAGLYNDLIQTVQNIEATTGFNAITTGEPNPKTLTPGYETANISTDDALAPLAFGERWLTGKLAEDVLCRMKQGLKKGDIEGTMPYKGALNTNTLTFMRLDASLADREHGIMIQEASTEQEREWLMGIIQGDIANGTLDISDAVLIINTHNVKAAQQILSYRVKKNKQEMAQQKQAEIQSAGQQSQMAAQIAANAQLQARKMDADVELQKKKMETDSEIQKELIRQQYALQIARETNLSKESVSQTTGQAKIISSHVSNIPKLMEGEEA